MKIKANKLIAVLCAVVMIVSTMVPALTLTAFAEDTVITFTLGSNGTASHHDGSEMKNNTSYTVNGYTLTITGFSKVYTGARDAKGNSALKLGTSSAVGKFSFTVPDDVTSVNIYVAKYKSNTTKINVNNKAYTISGASNNGAYDKIVVDTSATKTVNFTTVSGGVRCMINTIEFVVTPPTTSCEHANTTTTTTPATCTTAGQTVVTCNDCEDYTKTTPIAALGHECNDWVKVADPTCDENGSEEAVCERCGETQTKVIAATGHEYADGVCTVCGGLIPLSSTINFGSTAMRTELTGDTQVWEADGVVFTNNKAGSTNAVADYSNPVRIYKSSQIVITASGIITELVIVGGGNAEYKTPIKTSLENAGYTVTVSGDNYIIHPNSDTVTFTASAQIRFASIKVTLEAPHVHNFVDATCTAPKTCSCGATEGEALGHSYNAEVTAPDCVNGGYTTYTCGTCGDTYTGNATEALGHDFADATCTAPKTCSVCGATEGEALGHTFVNSICACGAGSIEASFLQVQVREDGMADVRLVLTLTADELATLSEVGVYASLNKDNKGAGYATTTVYETVNAGGKVVEAKEGTYFVLVEIINISDFDAKIYVTPFVATETTEALGAMVAFSVNQYID